MEHTTYQEYAFNLLGARCKVLPSVRQTPGSHFEKATCAPSDLSGRSEVIVVFLLCLCVKVCNRTKERDTLFPLMVEG